MHILLINPTRTGYDTYVSPPLHLIYISDAIRKNGHTTEIIDVHFDFCSTSRSSGEKLNFEIEAIDKITSKKFDVIGIGSIVSAFDFTKNLSLRVKTLHPHRPIIVGGGMAMALKKIWFEKTAVDYLVESDGELVIQEFIENLHQPEKLKKIPGLYYRGVDSFVATRPPYVKKNLDYIDMPNWSQLPNLEKYLNIQKAWWQNILPEELKLKENDIIYPVVFSRGCPYHCTFCYHVNSVYRKHSVDYVVQFLRKLKDSGVTHVATWDELIVADGKWLAELCDEIVAQKIEITIFTSGGKPNLVDPVLLAKMRKAGFKRMSFGIESGSPSILEQMKKMTTVEQNFNAVKQTVESGIFVHSNMVVGMPGETKKTLKETEDFILRLAKLGIISSTNLSFAFATGYPGTELYQYMIDNHIINCDEETYLKIQKGVGDYPFKLSVLCKNELRFFIGRMLALSDYYYWIKKNKRLLAIKLFTFRYSKAFIARFLPEKLVGFLINSFIRPRKLKELVKS